MFPPACLRAAQPVCLAEARYWATDSHFARPVRKCSHTPARRQRSHPERQASSAPGPGFNEIARDPTHLPPGHRDAMEVLLCARKRSPWCSPPAEQSFGSSPFPYPREQAEVRRGAVSLSSAVRRSCLLRVLIPRFRLSDRGRPVLGSPFRPRLLPTIRCRLLRRRCAHRLPSSKLQHRESYAASSPMSRPRPHYLFSDRLPCACPRRRSSA